VKAKSKLGAAVGSVLLALIATLPLASCEHVKVDQGHYPTGAGKYGP
jgi:hypothetical protein